MDQHGKNVLFVVVESGPQGQPGGEDEALAPPSCWSHILPNHFPQISG